MDRLTGIHAIREALEAGSAFDRILIAKGRQDTRVEEIVQLARAQNIPVRFEDRSQLDRLASSRDHQGVVAIAAARPRPRSKVSWQKPTNPKARSASSFSSTASKIPTTSAPSFAPPSPPAHTASSSLNAAPRASPTRWRALQRARWRTCL